MRTGKTQNVITIQNGQPAGSVLLVDIWDETREEYEERKTQEFANWLTWLRSATYTFEVL